MGKRFFVPVLLFLAGSALQAQQPLPGYRGFWEGRRETAITVLDLVPFYPDDLPRLRNEIYARYGRPFSASAWKEYFSAQGWYREWSNYSDSWLSPADVWNADFIRSFEQAPDAGAARAGVLRTIEYRGGRAVLTFISGKELIWTDPAVDFGAYGMDGNNARTLPWLPLGDWVLVYRESPYNDTYQVAAYRLDHASGTVVESVTGEVGIRALRRLFP